MTPTHDDPGSAARAGRTATPPTILVTDDDEGMLRLLEEWLEAKGYKVLTALDADSAMAILGSSRVDVAVCDILMPGRDGIWLINQINARYPSTAIVIVTGVQDLPPAVTLGPGVVSYVTKPFDVDVLDAAIRRATLSTTPQLFDLRRSRDTGHLPEL